MQVRFATRLNPAFPQGSLRFGSPSNGTTPQKIYFYRSGQPYHNFTNFSLHPIDLDSKTWPTTEHYYQAQKFLPTDPLWAESIRLSTSPKVAKDMGRDKAHPVRADWDQVKDDVMRHAVLKKFQTYPALRAELLGTQSAELFEDSPKDAYWGVGPTGNGQNKLGKLLVEIRELMRQGKA